MRKLLMLFMVLSSFCFAEKGAYFDSVKDEEYIWRSANDYDNDAKVHSYKDMDEKVKKYFQEHAEGSPVDSIFRKHWQATCDQAHAYKHTNSKAPAWICYYIYCHTSEPSEYVFAHWNKTTKDWDLLIADPKDTTSTVASKGIPVEFWNGSNGLQWDKCESDYNGKFLNDVPPARYKTVERNLSFLTAEKVKGFDGLNQIFKKVKEDRIKYVLTDKPDTDGELFYQVIYRTEKIKEVKEKIPY